jgi:hypothetical protein
LTADTFVGVRIHIATVGDAEKHRVQSHQIAALAEADTVGVHKQEHDPGAADAILFVDIHINHEDHYLREFWRNDLVRSYPGKVFVLDHRDRPFFTVPGIYVSARSTSGFNTFMRGGPYPRLPNTFSPATAAPDLLFSFQGARTHPVRDAILNLRHPRAIVEDTARVSFFPWEPTATPEARRAGRARYAEMVQRSKFILCPRGHGTSSFRLYETLSAGRVPVVVGDQWLVPPRVDWDSGIIRVRERSVHLIPEILEQAEAGWEEKAVAARALWDQHFDTGRLWHEWAESLAELAGVPRARISAPWWLQRDLAEITLRRYAHKVLDPVRSRRA